MKKLNELKELLEEFSIKNKLIQIENQIKKQYKGYKTETVDFKDTTSLLFDVTDDENTVLEITYIPKNNEILSSIFINNEHKGASKYIPKKESLEDFIATEINRYLKLKKQSK